MAQITLNTKLNSESFTINDSDIVYLLPLVVDGSTVGSKVIAIDTANVDTQVIEVEESIATIIGLTNSLIQVTLSDKSTPYISIQRIKDIITEDNLAVIRYDGNGNVFQTLYTSMTTAQILTAISTEVGSPKVYRAVISQSGTTAPTVDYVLENTLDDSPTFYYDNIGLYRIGSADFGNNDPVTTTTVWAIIQNSGNQNNSGRAVDCYTTTAPVPRGGEACEIALESVAGTTPTNGFIYKCAIEILVYP